MTFPTLKEFRIPEGKVTRFSIDGKVYWKAAIDTPDMPDTPDIPETPTTFNYVSLGDSIAAGHLITYDWYKAPYYGHLSQYGQEHANADGSTVIVENTYTDIMDKYLCNIYGKDHVKTTSFARSGSRLNRPNDPSKSLLSFLDRPVIQNAIREADLVTVCIGANDILEPALDVIEPYLLGNADLDTLKQEILANLRVMADNTHEHSYRKLFDKLDALLVKPNAKVVFTTVYNPVKFLHIEKGTWGRQYQDGFFGPLLEKIPAMSLLGLPDLLDIDNEIRKLILESSVMSEFMSRINILSDWVEALMESSDENAVALNPILRKKIAEYSNPKFILADTKAQWDAVPDRLGQGEAHYNDLVNNQVTKGANIRQLPWYRLWSDTEEYGEKQEAFVKNLINSCITVIKNELVCNEEALTSNFLKTLITDVLLQEEPIKDIIDDTVNKIVHPSIDAHPKAGGHYALFRSFIDALGWEFLPTVTYSANGGQDASLTRKVLDGTMVSNAWKRIYHIISGNIFNPPSEGYRMICWKDSNGVSYQAGQQQYINSTTTLYAQWSNKYTLTYRHGLTDKAKALVAAAGEAWEDHTGNMECYDLYIDFGDGSGQAVEKLFEFTSGSKTFTLPYGTNIGLIVKVYSGSAQSFIQYNGNKTALARKVDIDFKMQGDVDIYIEWNKWKNNNLTVQSHWEGYVNGPIKITNITHNS